MLRHCCAQCSTDVASGHEHIAAGLVMSRPVRIIIGVIVLLVGALWTLQGLGYIGGSAMSGVTLWAVIGPIVAVAGLGLALSRPRRQP